MTVYVDHARHRYRGFVMSHMLADSLEELHSMADRIGVARRHFQPRSTPHYDVCQSKRSLAIRFGAVKADRRKVVEIIRQWRQAAGSRSNEDLQR